MMVDTGIGRGLAVALWLLTVPSLLHAAQPLDEIRTIIAQKALLPPPANTLKSLKLDDLAVGLQKIDAYARYVPAQPASSKASQSRCLGIEMFAHNFGIWIKPDQGGPADRAGVPEVGELKAVDGKDVAGQDLASVSRWLDITLRKDRVPLSITTPSTPRGRVYSIQPAVCRLPSVTWRRVGRNLFLSVSEFVSHDTAPSLQARLTALRRPGDRLVLDLRGCSGGDLFEALEIAGIFVPAGRPLVSLDSRSGRLQYRSPKGKKKKSPDFIIIDRFTASAAEILAGILQYHQLSRVMGERSHGKCVSQSYFPLSDRGGLWLTTTGIRFPDDTSCNGLGITPDLTYPDVPIVETATIVKKIDRLGIPDEK
jgi:carboxyl-terminal processing protease